MMSEEDNSWGVITSILDRLGTLVSYSALKMFLWYSAILKSCTDLHKIPFFINWNSEFCDEN